LSLHASGHTGSSGIVVEVVVDTTTVVEVTVVVGRSVVLVVVVVVGRCTVQSTAHVAPGVPLAVPSSHASPSSTSPSPQVGTSAITPVAHVPTYRCTGPSGSQTSDLATRLRVSAFGGVARRTGPSGDQVSPASRVSTTRSAAPPA